MRSDRLPLTVGCGISLLALGANGRLVSLRLAGNEKATSTNGTLTRAHTRTHTGTRSGEPPSACGTGAIETPGSLTHQATACLCHRGLDPLSDLFKGEDALSFLKCLSKDYRRPFPGWRSNLKNSIALEFTESWHIGHYCIFSDSQIGGYAFRLPLQSHFEFTSDPHSKTHFDGFKAIHFEALLQPTTGPEDVIQQDSMPLHINFETDEQDVLDKESKLQKCNPHLPTDALEGLLVVSRPDSVTKGSYESSSALVNKSSISGRTGDAQRDGDSDMAGADRPDAFTSPHTLVAESSMEEVETSIVEETGSILAERVKGRILKAANGEDASAFAGSKFVTFNWQAQAFNGDEAIEGNSDVELGSEKEIVNVATEDDLLMSILGNAKTLGNGGVLIPALARAKVEVTHVLHMILNESAGSADSADNSVEESAE